LKVGAETFTGMATLEAAVSQYLTNAKDSKSEERQVGTLYCAGAPFGTIARNGTVHDLKGAVISQAVSKEEPASTVSEAPAAALDTVQLGVKDLAALLQIAGKDDARYYLNSIFIHQVGDQLRLVASDGHRLMVISRDHQAQLSWGEAGVIVPRDRLDGIVKYADKSEGGLIDFTLGNDRPSIEIQSRALGATFKLQAIDAKYPEYQRIIDTQTSAALIGERNPLEGSSVNPKYLKSAGAVAKILEADAISTFAGQEGATLMTFAKNPGIVLYVMPMTGEPDKGLADKTIRVLGRDAMAGSLAALKACETRARNAAKAAKSKAENAAQTEKAAGFAARREALLATLSNQLAAPAPVAKPEEDGDSEGDQA
jgi:DNA polymerase-3 subunit beta